MSVRPAKTQISPVWSESSLCAHWVAKDSRFLHAESEDSDQTGQMPRLSWVFAGRTLILLLLSCCVSFQFLTVTCKGQAWQFSWHLLDDVYMELRYESHPEKTSSEVCDQVGLKPASLATEATPLTTTFKSISKVYCLSIKHLRTNIILSLFSNLFVLKNAKTILEIGCQIKI